MLMHLLLLVFLWVGVSWQNTVPVSIEAEIWSPQLRVAAPPAPEPEPSPDPKPVITPPKPQPAPEPQAKMPDPDIALEKEKQRKQALEKKLAEEKRKEKEQEKEKQRLAEAQEKKKLAELEKKKQLEDQKRKQEEAAEAQRDKVRRDNNLKRLQALAGEGTPTSTGDAERSSGPKTDANYLGKIAGRIKSNTRFANTDAIPGNPTVEYELELLPDGSVKEIKITRASGYAAYDEAVKRAIYLSAPFPPDPSSGRVPSSIAARQRLKEN